MKKALILLTVFAVLSFTQKQHKKFKKLDTFAFVPSGSIQLDDQSYSCEAFYMATTEVTNYQYREFLNSLKKSGEKEKYKIALPDTTQWVEHFENEALRPFQEVYFSHPAYDGFPVVNVSQEGAMLYCEWLTKEMRKQFPDQNFNDFRLPSKQEWVYAARGGLDNATYPWGGSYLMNSKGDYLANYAQIGDQNIITTEDGKMEIKNKFDRQFVSRDAIQVVAPAKSYYPNGFGLYNMSGNCAEMVNSKFVLGGGWTSPGGDITVTSSRKYEGANPTIGFRPIVSYVNVD
jgi:sulfatase modifying factor 1